MAQFEGKVALVTGAGSGIGRACAEAFAREGAKVVVSDISEDSGAQTVDLIQSKKGEAIFLGCDVSNSKDVQQLISSSVEKFGRLDFACNNAGIEGKPYTTSEYPEEVWDRVIAVNLTGVWLCTKYELVQMVKQRSGAIVNMASILGWVGFATAPAYVAAKHGVLGLTKTAAIEYAMQGIRINAVCPGFIYTPMLERGGMAKGTDLYNQISSLHPINRMGTPEEVAGAVLWLCSDSSSFVTGQALLVDGGYVAR